MANEQAKSDQGGPGRNFDLKKAQRPGCLPARQSDTDEDGEECSARDAVGPARVPGNFDTKKDVKVSLKSTRTAFHKRNVIMQLCFGSKNDEVVLGLSPYQRHRD